MPDPAPATSQNPERGRHGEDDKQADAAALWGEACGPHGTLKAQLEILAEHGRTKAGVRIAESGGGLFTFGLHFESPEKGFGFFPSVWREAFGSRDEAVRAAVEGLIERIGDAPSKGSEESFRRVKELLRASLEPRQLDLFDLGPVAGEGQLTMPPVSGFEEPPSPD
ncbi:MAG: hypothetical protein U0797_00585 [Gemmataceae bacterium]